MSDNENEKIELTNPQLKQVIGGTDQGSCTMSAPSGGSIQCQYCMSKTHVSAGLHHCPRYGKDFPCLALGSLISGPIIAIVPSVGGKP